MVRNPLQRGLLAQVAACTALLAAFLAMPVRVQAASQATVATQWVVLHGARVRLVAGPAAGNAMGYLAGIEVESDWITGPVTLTNNEGPAFLGSEAGAEVEANRISGPLTCHGNTPGGDCCRLPANFSRVEARCVRATLTY